MHLFHVLIIAPDLPQYLLPCCSCSPAVSGCSLPSTVSLSLGPSVHLFHSLVLRVPVVSPLVPPSDSKCFPPPPTTLDKASICRVIHAELLGKRLQKAELNKLGGAMDLPWWPSMLVEGCRK
jgi:hypothetical protein